MATADEVADKLGRLDDDDLILAAVHAGGLVIEADAKERAPVFTGQLKRNIGTEVKKESETRFKAKIGNTADVPYAVFQEMGTRNMPAKAYLRGALRTKAKQAAQDMAEALRQGMKARMGGGE